MSSTHGNLLRIYQLYLIAMVFKCDYPSHHCLVPPSIDNEDITDILIALSNDESASSLRLHGTSNFFMMKLVCMFSPVLRIFII